MVTRPGPALEVLLPLWLRGGDTCLFQSSQVMPREPPSRVWLSCLLWPTLQGVLDLLGLHGGVAAEMEPGGRVRSPVPGAPDTCACRVSP